MASGIKTLPGRLGHSGGQETKMTKEELSDRIQDLVSEFLNSGGYIKEAAEVTKEISDIYKEMYEINLEEDFDDY